MKPTPTVKSFPVRPAYEPRTAGVPPALLTLRANFSTDPRHARPPDSRVPHAPPLRVGAPVHPRERPWVDLHLAVSESRKQLHNQPRPIKSVSKQQLHQSTSPRVDNPQPPRQNQPS